MSPGDFGLFGAQEDAARAVDTWRRILTAAKRRALSGRGGQHAPSREAPVDTQEARAFWASVEASP